MRANSSPFGVGTPAPFRFWLGEHTQPRFWASGLPRRRPFLEIAGHGKAPVLRPGVGELGDEAGLVRLLGLKLADPTFCRSRL
jgi:hypothetical protein